MTSRYMQRAHPVANLRGLAHRYPSERPGVMRARPEEVCCAWEPVRRSPVDPRRADELDKYASSPASAAPSVINGRGGGLPGLMDISVRYGR